MAVYIQPESRNGVSGSLIWNSFWEKAFLKKALPHLIKTGEKYFSDACPWDCVGDILLYGMLEQRRAEKGTYKQWTGTMKIIMLNCSVFHSDYYKPKELLQFYLKLKPFGWNIILRKKENSMDSMFKMDCPSFEDYLNESCNGLSLLPVKGAIVDTNTVLSGKPEKEARAYCHPVDGAIIKVLDNPVVNSAFKSYIDMVVDVQYGTTIASGIPVNETTFPELDAIVEHCAKTLRITRPYVIVSGSQGFNACTMGSDEEPYIIIGNFLAKAMSEEQLRFVIGHECGHIAMGHMVYHNAVTTAGSLANAIPVIGPVIYKTASFAINAWSRRSEITADRAGLLCCGSLDLAKNTLMQLEMGFMSADNVDVNTYIEISKKYRKGGILRNIGEYFASHPILPKRMQALEAFTNSELFYRVTGQRAPDGAMNDKVLAKTVEDLIQVLGKEKKC